MERNRFRRWFFGQGQIISTNRGAGVYQDAIDISTQKLNEGKWVCFSIVSLAVLLFH